VEGIMLEQQKVNRSRMVGYTIGIVVFAAVIAWKWMAR
jgi:hypothetical protein